MNIFTRYWLILAACCMTTLVGAQIPLGVYFEAECVDRSGTDYVVEGDIAASNDRYLTAGKESVDGPVVPDTRIFKYDFNLDIPFVELLDIAVFGRFRATVETQSLLQVRVNGSEWFLFEGSIEPSDTFAWIPAPQRLSNLRQGKNTVEIAIMEVGTQLDKLYFTVTNEVPTGKGGPTFNCIGYDFEPNMDPVAVAIAEPDSGAAPLMVQLDGSSSFDDDGTIVSYDWAWENGGMATGPNPMATFAAGTYNVTLTVTDDFNATDTDEVTVTVTEPMVDGTTSMFWLEAECAMIGSDWSYRGTEDASGGQALAVDGKMAMRMMPPADDPANRIRYTLEDVEAGAYSLFARINAPGPLSDSYWVRVNGGEWYAWKQGIRQAEGYRWNRYPAGKVMLTSGTNVIDFAFRESGAELDKIHLNKTGIKPTGLGEMATNCADENATRFALEAECAPRGSGWRIADGAMASNGKYLVYLGASDFNVPMNPDASRAITFDIEVTEATTYYAFLRMSAPDVGSNSFWVRVDDGNWIKMWKETDGRELSTKGFEWRRLADSGTPVSFDLTEGSHTITVVNREQNTRLDKIYLSADDRLPVGTGVESTNCGFTPLPAFLAAAPPVMQSLVTTQELSLNVFPNPASSKLNIDLETEIDGQVTVAIYDLTGRQLSTSVFEKASDRLRLPIDVSDLAPGMYQLRVLAGDRSIVKAFIKQ